MGIDWSSAKLVYEELPRLGYDIWGRAQSDMDRRFDFSDERLARYVLTPHWPAHKRKRDDHWYTVREKALAEEIMWRAGYHPLKDSNGVPIPGGDWADDPAELRDEDRIQAMRDRWRRWFRDRNALFTIHKQDRWHVGSGLLAAAWQRFNELQLWKGPNLAAVSAGENDGLEELWRIWAGPAPPAALGRPWYVEAWPVWVALGAWVWSGRR